MNIDIDRDFHILQHLLDKSPWILLGIMIGYGIRLFMEGLAKQNLTRKQKIQIDSMTKVNFQFNASTFILIVVTLIWAASTVYDIYSIEYETPLALHTIMGFIVGFFFKPVNLGGMQSKK